MKFAHTVYVVVFYEIAMCKAPPNVCHAHVSAFALESRIGSQGGEVHHPHWPVIGVQLEVVCVYVRSWKNRGCAAHPHPPIDIPTAKGASRDDAA
eukprot:6489630-Amphidinium_carterae.2